MSITFIGREVKTSMNQLTELDKQQWSVVLKEFDLDVDNLPYDWFSDAAKYETDEYNEEIWIDIWRVGDVTFRDVYGWPGDNQMGCIFVGENLIPLYCNSDCDLVQPYDRESQTKYSLDFVLQANNIGHMSKELLKEFEDFRLELDERIDLYTRLKLTIG